MVRPFETLCALALLVPSVCMFFSIQDGEIRSHLLLAALSSVACFAATVWAVPNAASYLRRRGLVGKDRGKAGTPAGAVEMCVRGLQ